MTASPKLSQKSIFPVVLNSFRSLMSNWYGSPCKSILPDESAYLFPRGGKVIISFGITLSKDFSVKSYNLISSNIQLCIFVAMNRVKFRSNIWSYDSSLIHCISHLLFYKGSLLVPGSWDKSREGFVVPINHVFKV